MTLGGKIREARRKCGFSQGQLATRMSVSRSAIAKWETDKGLPDVGNLKMLAKLLNVSIDQLLDEGESEVTSVIRENYNLSAYGSGCSRVKKDRVVRPKYPDARIWPLLGQQNPASLDLFSEHIFDCRTSPGDRWKQTDKLFYLIEKEDRQFLVTVTDEYVETRPLEGNLQESSFSIADWNFVKCNYEIEK